MDELQKIIQQQYVNEYLLRRRLGLLLTLTSLLFSMHSIIRGEIDGIIVMCIAFSVVMLLPPPKGWQENVKRHSRKPMYAMIKCTLGLAAFMINYFTAKWHIESTLALLLLIYGTSITPCLGKYDSKRRVK